MYGWTGTLLRVDLSSGRIEKEPPDRELGASYIGGREINARILYDGHRPDIDPQRFEQMLTEYYRMRGWDVKTAPPAGPPWRGWACGT
ncbi:MAG: hypothetical protein HYS70_04410 [Nitrospinae bacterium]|nr:hypothetical protein [Nitrospinota bacterium]